MAPRRPAVGVAGCLASDLRREGLYSALDGPHCLLVTEIFMFALC